MNIGRIIKTAMLGPLLLIASPFFAQGGIRDEPKKEYARSWYAGVQSNVPFGIGMFSSFDVNGNIRTSDVTADRMLPGAIYRVFAV